MASRHGCVALLCCFERFTRGRVARSWKLIDSRVGEKFCPIFTRLYRTAASPPVVLVSSLYCGSSVQG
ncbi:hypothetical protein GOBAR_AA06148 [Gossypium barbadense]|uniref:Uncharacterized protein n=1 Tax=Gossypium barbadense TaxID=3634 RepID=A0A2P5YFU0_GOSBA|nr:hypothetical protein GOBAR_AA06148 [Gossypium barbadense]